MAEKLSKAIGNFVAEMKQRGDAITSFRAELEQIEKQPMKFDEWWTGFSEELDRIAANGRERFVDAAISRSLETKTEIFLGLVIDYPVNSDAVMRFLAFAFNAELKRNLTKTLQEIWPKDSIGAEERQAKVAELRSKIKQLEGEEEQIALELEELGIEVSRRPDLSPEVFLEFRETDEKVIK